MTIYRSRKLPFDLTPWAAVAAVAVLLACAITLAVLDYAKVDQTGVVLIDNKESVNTDEGHEYRVYTDQGTFVVKDSLIHPRFRSADFYGRLKVGERYRCDKFGWRIPFFSVFENLKTCERVSQ